MKRNGLRGIVAIGMVVVLSIFPTKVMLTPEIFSTTKKTYKSKRCKIPKKLKPYYYQACHIIYSANRHRGGN